MNKEKFITDSLNESAETKQKILQHCKDDILKAVDILTKTFKNNNKLLLCGNGGSAADCQHIATELVIRLNHNINRPALPAIALTTDSSNLTAGGNDIGFDNIFARSIEGLGNKGDTLLAISTSGNSENIIRAVKKAKEKGMKIISLLGGSGGKLILLNCLLLSLLQMFRGYRKDTLLLLILFVSLLKKSSTEANKLQSTNPKVQINLNS